MWGTNMNINGMAKILLLLVTFWPIIFFVYSGVFIYDEFLKALMLIAHPGSANLEQSILVWLHILTLVIVFCTFAYYSYRLLHDQHVPEESRMTWLLAFIVLTSLAFLAYWLVYIWRSEYPHS